jgi:Xaa-Pro aminopeptidase
MNMDAFLSENNLDGFLFIGDSICHADMFYLSHFFATDRFTILATDRIYLLVSGMERGRAGKESCAYEVTSTSDYGIMDKLHSLGKPDEAYLAVLKEFLRDHGMKRLGVHLRFPAELYRRLSKDFQISILESPVSKWRAIKSDWEIEAINSTQRSCEGAMRLAIDLISKSEPVGERLYLDGVPLTSEKVRGAIEVSLLESGCDAIDTIVAGGLEAANPHARGSGPLPANAPIVLDIFPRSKGTRYFADMTRTVLRGEATVEVKEIYDAVLDAQLTGLVAVRAGVSGRDIHARVCQVFKDHGYSEREGRGFTHSTGHGVGLDIHERPSLSEAGEVLEANNVVTIEPGLYYPEIGGIRIEDLVVVTAQGCDNLTHFERQLII